MHGEWSCSGGFHFQVHLGRLSGCSLQVWSSLELGSQPLGECDSYCCYPGQQASGCACTSSCACKLDWLKALASRCPRSAPSFGSCPQHGDPFNIFETVFGGGGGGQRMHFQFQQGGGMGGGEASALLFVFDSETFGRRLRWWAAASLVTYHAVSCASTLCAAGMGGMGGGFRSLFPRLQVSPCRMACELQAWAAGGHSERRQASTITMHSCRCGDADVRHDCLARNVPTDSRGCILYVTAAGAAAFTAVRPCPVAQLMQFFLFALSLGLAGSDR